MTWEPKNKLDDEDVDVSDDDDKDRDDDKGKKITSLFVCLQMSPVNLSLVCKLDSQFHEKTRS